MSGITHKESLRGHERIKRRRVDPLTSTNDTGASVVTEETATAAPTEAKETIAASAVRATPDHGRRSTSSSSSSDEDDDDLEAIQREQVRLAKLREQRDRRTAGESPSGMGGGSAGHADGGAPGGGVSVYDSDVLFRRQDWRGGGANESKKRADQWSKVTNSTQASATYKQSMKNFFK